MKLLTNQHIVILHGCLVCSYLEWLNYSIWVHYHSQTLSSSPPREPSIFWVMLSSPLWSLVRCSLDMTCLQLSSSLLELQGLFCKHTRAHPSLQDRRFFIWWLSLRKLSCYWLFTATSHLSTISISMLTKESISSMLRHTLPVLGMEEIIDSPLRWMRVAS